MAADRTLERYAWLSLGAALATIALKTLAWTVTGSVGLLSDALEALINVFAAASIAVAAVPRLAAPQPLEAPALGIALSLAATAINLGVALKLLSVGRRLHSIALEADGHHLITDVWTSVGVVAGVALVAATGWLILDPLIALAVAALILWTGFILMRRSFAGLLDAAIPAVEISDIEKIFAEYRRRYGVEFHALLTRQAGARRFVSFHLLVPDAWPVDRAHQLSEEIEERIRSLVPKAITLSHIEPISQPASYDDISCPPRCSPGRAGSPSFPES